MSDAPAVDRVKKDRSPPFPFISLRKAIERARQFSESHKRAPTRLPALATTWNYGVKSSGLQQTVAALKQFGLVEDLGGGEERKFQLSDLAWRILVDARPNVKEAAIREAAVRPKLIAEYASEWLPDRPSDAHCVSELHLDRGFTLEAAATFLRVFDETVAFADLSEAAQSNTSGDEVFDRSDNEIKPIYAQSRIKLGDFVQMDPTSAMKFPEPRRVIGIHQDQNHGTVAAVEGYAGSVLIDHLVPVDATSAFPTNLVAQWLQGGGQAKSPSAAPVQRATFPLPEGLVALEIPGGPLSQESLEDLQAWLEVMLRRAKRSSGARTSQDDIGEQYL